MKAQLSAKTSKICIGMGLVCTVYVQIITPWFSSSFSNLLATLLPDLVVSVVVPVDKIYIVSEVP